MSEFPQYRKLSNNMSYYCIAGETHFTEIQIIGQKVFEIKIQAIQYPEKLKIKDMLNCQIPYFKIEKEEFERVKSAV